MSKNQQFKPVEVRPVSVQEVIYDAIAIPTALSSKDIIETIKKSFNRMAEVGYKAKVSFQIAGEAITVFEKKINPQK